MPRLSKDHYYLNIAKEISQRSTCLRRKFGAVIVKKDQILSTGYGGSPRKTRNCIDIGMCVRNEFGAKKGEHYEWCRAVHAEQNAIIHASRLDMLASTLYLVGLDFNTGEVVVDAEPCKICKRLIINSGISNVKILKKDNGIKKISVQKDWVKQNIGEIEYKNGKWIAIVKEGYR